MRPLIRTLIVRGLGYCCLWAFFSIFRKTGPIADRLGVHPSNIRRYKARMREGEFKCEDCAKCMKEQVRAVKVLGKKELGL